MCWSINVCWSIKKIVVVGDVKSTPQYSILYQKKGISKTDDYRRNNTLKLSDLEKEKALLRQKIEYFEKNINEYKKKEYVYIF